MKQKPIKYFLIMNTLYLNMSKKTANQLLILSSIFGVEETDRAMITLSYTKGYADYPEPILNLKWSLAGECKILRHDEYKGNPAGLIKDLFSLINDTITSSKANNFWRSLYVSDFGTKGKDLKTGVNDIFTKLSADIELGDTGFYLPQVFLWKEKHDSFVKTFYFSKEKNRFNGIFHLLPYLCEIERQLK